MMRIIGGRYRGRDIQSPETEDTRPIADAAREALFNMLGDVEGLSWLDAYAGSGSVALEALSRGASRATALDRSKLATETISDNARNLGIGGELTVASQPVERWLDEMDESFDIVFADPPFDYFDAEKLRQLASRAGKLFILKHSRRQKPIDIEGMELVRSRRYGDSKVSIYKAS